MLPGILLLSAALAGAEPVRTESGLVSGTVDGDILVYKGIPFAVLSA